MAGKKGRSGGKRTGSGRPSLKEKQNKSIFTLSDQAKDTLEYYSKTLCLSKSDIVDDMCLLYLSSSNKDIVHCPKCYRPLCFEPVQNLHVGDFEIKCDCGEVVLIKGETF